MLAPIGEMREQVVILTPVRSVDASGGETFTYTESDPLFVSLRPMNAAESVQFQQVDAEVTNVCFGHWQSLNQVGSNNRIKILETGQEFDINGGPINDPKRAWTRLNLIARENA